MTPIEIEDCIRDILKVKLIEQNSSTTDTYALSDDFQKIGKKILFKSNNNNKTTHFIVLY